MKVLMNKQIIMNLIIKMKIYEESDDYIAIMIDYYTNKESNLRMPCSNTDNDISCYFEENLNDYTLYKYT